MTSNRLFLPALDISLARRLSHHGSWYDAHKLLAEKGTRMPLLSEIYALFSKSLQNSQGVFYSKERSHKIRKNILKPRPKIRIELIDAFFVFADGQWYLHQRHMYEGSRLRPQEKIPLDHFLQEEGRVSLDSLATLILPLKKTEGKYPVHYWPPQDRCVASLIISDQGAELRCNQSPISDGLHIGARPVYSLKDNVVSLDQRLSSTA